MDPTRETSTPTKVERLISAVNKVKTKGTEVAKRVLPERTRNWLQKATGELRRKGGREAFEVLSEPPLEPTDTENRDDKTVESDNSAGPEGRDLQSSDKENPDVKTEPTPTEANVMTLSEDLLNDNLGATLKREQIFFNIANGGSYIPVVNPNGEIIFTEEDYNRYRLNHQAITRKLADQEFNPDEFISLLKTSPFLKTLYGMSAGVMEGYSTEEHTQMVMNQFERYFSKDFDSALLTREDFRLMLSLHDIGKPLSVFFTRSVGKQHEYTIDILTNALQAIDISSQKADIIVNLVNQDILGEYFKDRTDSQFSAYKIKALAKTIGVPPRDLIDTLKMYYVCDAGSYPELSKYNPRRHPSYPIFVSSNEKGEGRIRFSDQIEAKYQDLLNALKAEDEDGKTDGIIPGSKTIPTAPPISIQPEDPKTQEELEIAMGMRRKPVAIEESAGTDPATTVAIEQEAQQKKEPDNLIQGNDIESLVQQKDNPQAQVVAIVLMSNSYRNFNVRSDVRMNSLSSVDIEVVSQSLGLDSEPIENNRNALLEARERFHEIDAQKSRIVSRLRIAYEDEEPKLQRKLEELNTQEIQIEAEMHRLYRELMLPIRTAVLSSTDLPEAYKLHAIEGIKGFSDVLPQEDHLLKQAYATGNDTIKRQVIDTVIGNIGHDLNSFDVIPINDLRNLGTDADKIFLATLGNTHTNGDFVETRVAPTFFPEEKPTEVRKCYEVLKKANGYTSRFMSIDVFKSFMDNSEDLIPVVEVLSDYGFVYMPFDVSLDKFSEEYIYELKKLGENTAQLRLELDSIKTVLPDYKYDFKVDIRTLETKTKSERYIESNPFAIALKSRIYTRDINSIDDINEAVQLFESLQRIVPDRWRGEFISTYVEMMSETAGYFNKTSEITRRAISEANKYVFDEDMTPEQIELFATKFFESSLDTKNENTEMAVNFCKKYGDRIRTWIDNQRQVDANSTWYKLSLLVSDLYRYPISSEREEIAIAKARSDLAWAVEAVDHIDDHVLKDKAIVNLIYALTDQEIGNIEKAEQLVDIMQDVNLRESSQAEIELEKERLSKGETTTWKKMEKVLRATTTNVKVLKDLFGYSSLEELDKARKEYWGQFKTFPDHLNSTFNPENLIRLNQEIKRIRDDFHVTLNITWANVLKVLETGRVISIWENREVMDDRNKSKFVHYETIRDKTERLLGNRAKGGIRDPHPVYGAAASINGRDEFYGGSGGAFGECFLVLKSDRVKNRTSFVYDDSFDGYSKWVLDWDSGIVAKAIHNLNGNKSMHNYVEAQILGGVTIDDIESINIPSDAISGENKYSFSSGTDALSKIDELQKKYPGIKINIIQVPTT